MNKCVLQMTPLVRSPTLIASLLVTNMSKPTRFLVLRPNATLGRNGLQDYEKRTSRFVSPSKKLVLNEAKI